MRILLIRKSGKSNKRKYTVFNCRDPSYSHKDKENLIMILDHW